MEDDISNAAFLLYGLFWATLLILIIYFAIKRYNDKKKESFEQRDN